MCEITLNTTHTHTHTNTHTYKILAIKATAFYIGTYVLFMYDNIRQNYF